MKNRSWHFCPVYYSSVSIAYEAGSNPAMVHLESGLKILHDMRRDSAVKHLIEDNIAPLFMRLSIQAIIYLDTKSAHDQTNFAKKLMAVSGKEIIISEGFESVEEARSALNQAAGGMLWVFYMWE